MASTQQHGTDTESPARRGATAPDDLTADATSALANYVSGYAETLSVAQLDSQGRILYENAALARLAGRSLRGERIHQLTAQEQWPALDAALARAGAEWEQIMLGLAPDAHGVPVDFVVALRGLPDGWLMAAEPAEGAVRMVNQRLLTLNDELAGAQRRITRQAAELERQNERLRELDQLKDALLANVSHDLRTPLTAILGYAELMARRGGLSEQQARSAAVIERNARRLLRMVNDLLFLAQARAGRLEIAREPVDLAELVHDAYELARPLAAQAQLDLGCVAPPEGALTITGDRLRLDQMLDNLLANALKFTPPGGHVTVRALSGVTGPALEVQDDGPGIAAADQDRLYDAFVRGATADAPGTGLGLTIVREIASAHGASVTVDCSDGVTRFAVTFPQQT